MNRRLAAFLWLLCLLTALTGIPASADGDAIPVSTIRETKAVLEDCARYTKTRVSLDCSDALYRTLSERDFLYISRLCYESGMDDFSLYYYSGSQIISLEEITYSDVPCYAYVETEQETLRAARGFMADGLDHFTLGCTDAAYGVLLGDERLYSVMAELGIRDFDLWYAEGTLYIENIQPYTGAWAAVADVSGAADRISRWHDGGLDSFMLAFGRDSYDALTNDDMDRIDFLGGIRTCYITKDPTRGAIFYTNVEWAEDPGLYCPTEDDIASAIRSMGSQGITAFRIMTTPEIYASFNENDFEKLDRLKADAGMSKCDMSYYIGLPVWSFRDAVITKNVTFLTTLEEVTNYMESCVENGDTSITLFLTEEMYDRLLEGYSDDRFSKGDTRLYDLVNNAGVSTCYWSYTRSSHIMTFEQLDLYAGTKILLAVRSGNEASLSRRERDTLAAARKMAYECSAGDDLTTLRNIHDALCAGIVYTLDDTTTEDDCAIGALLTGRANCDGYADAMYLVGNLAGLEIRYQHGDSLKQDPANLLSTHVWNAVRLNGTWRMVDVTWDDVEGGLPLYIWFNIGTDRASLSHVWHQDMTVPYAAVTDPLQRIEPEYTVSTREDVLSAVKNAETNGYGSYYLYLRQDSPLSVIDLESAVFDAAAGGYGYVCPDGMDCLRVSR